MGRIMDKSYLVTCASSRLSVSTDFFWFLLLSSDQCVVNILNPAWWLILKNGASNTTLLLLGIMEMYGSHRNNLFGYAVRGVSSFEISDTAQVWKLEKSAGLSLLFVMIPQLQKVGKTDIYWHVNFFKFSGPVCFRGILYQSICFLVNISETFARSNPKSLENPTKNIEICMLPQILDHQLVQKIAPSMSQYPSCEWYQGARW